MNDLIYSYPTKAYFGEKAAARHSRPSWKKREKQSCLPTAAVP